MLGIVPESGQFPRTASGRDLSSGAPQVSTPVERWCLAKKTVDLLLGHIIDLKHFAATGGADDQAYVSLAHAQFAYDEGKKRLISCLFDRRRGHPDLEIGAVSPRDLGAFGTRLDVHRYSYTRRHQ